MVEATEPGNLPDESTKPPAEPANPPVTETDNTAIDTALPHIDTSLPSIDSTLPAMDHSLPPIDSNIPTMDHSLPSIDTTLPSLPPIDTTLPPLEASDASLTTEDHPTDVDYRPSHDENSGHMGHASAPPPTSYTPAPTYQTPSNGYQYSQPPTPQQQPQQQHPNQQQPQQHYQPQQQSHPQQYQQQNHEMYHHPQANSAPMDHQQMQGQPGHVQQAPIGSPLPSTMPPMASVGQYMTGYPTNVAQMGMSPNAQMRYQLPGDPNKMLSGGRHKKEVKRRTKTGCLTCRKRRIKCDEGHPVCRNCVKSKRECLGYDPVFRPQPTTPSAIQPAPNPPPSLVVNPQDPSYPSAPPGYMPAASQPFAPSLSPATSTEQFDYGAAIDPALEGNASNMAAVQNATAEGNLQPPMSHATTGTATPSESTSFRVKQVQISDLIALRGIPPPPPHPITSLQPGRLEEIQAVFLATYAPAIDKFFETRWFQEKALSHLMANAQLMAEYSALIDAFNDRNLSDPNVVARLESFEASVVWSSMTLCRHVLSVTNGNHGQDNDLLAASKRLDVIESMITGEHLDTNPVAHYSNRDPAANPPSLPDQLMQRSMDFWSCIGHFLTLHDNEASTAKELDDTLGRCRTLLDTYENRDVIYSIAIARHIGQRWADFPRSIPQPVTTNEKDAGAKLFVAQKFLEQEAGGKGTTQVIKRICGMVVRSWIVSRE